MKGSPGERRHIHDKECQRWSQDGQAESTGVSEDEWGGHYKRANNWVEVGVVSGQGAATGPLLWRCQGNMRGVNRQGCGQKWRVRSGREAREGMERVVVWVMVEELVMMESWWSANWCVQA